MSMPMSRKVGTLGQFLVRAAPQVTSSRNLPEFTNCAQPLESAIALMWPPSSALVASALPLNGTCVHLMPLLLGDLLHGDVQAGAGAGRAVVELAGIGLGVGEEFAERLPRRLGFHNDAEGIAGEADDVGEVGRRIERHLGHERIAEDRDRDLRDGVAVGLGGRGHLRGARASLPPLPGSRSRSAGRGAFRSPPPAHAGQRRWFPRPARARSG